MNEGQFRAIVGRLDRIIELMEAQHELAQASMVAVQQAVEGLSDGAELPKPVPVGPKTKRSRT